MTTQSRVPFHLPFSMLALAMLCALTVIAIQPAQAQTFSVLHYFAGGSDGGNPTAGVTIAGPGLLYGTTPGGGSQGWGTVFKLAQRGSGWTLSPLYEFTGGSDGGEPLAGITVGPNGALYGTTYAGRNGDRGTIFEAQPPAAACKTAICYWNETVLHSFMVSDGEYPYYGNVTFDQAGNMYGTTFAGGASDCGVVWELAPSGGGWTESVLYNFTDGMDGCNPVSGVIFDSAGNLYGVTPSAGAGAGALFQLTPSDSGWVEHSLVEFNGTTGIHPYGTLIKDESGNLYGTARDNGPHGGGTVFELSPSNGGWTFALIYAFSSCTPYAGVTLGPEGNLYGVCQVGGAHKDGWVFEMPPNCNGSCTATDLHDFNGSEGSYPFGPVAFDASGNLYGTTPAGGIGDCGYGCGVAWEITP